MHRIDSPGATVGNLFTEGNPSLGVPATEVSDDWLNDVQEEIVNVIEDAGITLVKGTQDQLLDAIKLIIGLGGSQLNVDIANNQAAAADITGLSFDKASFKGGQVSFDLFRRTDSSDLKETGHLFVTHNPESDTWDIALSSHFEDAGVVFSITATGQIQYTSSNMAGTNYAGKIRVANVIKYKQTL
jgi:hypothetical protein